MGKPLIFLGVVLFVLPPAALATDPGTRRSKAATQAEITHMMLLTCTVCHGGRVKEGGLDLRTRAAMLKGGKSGPAFVPGQPEKSLLLKRVRSGNDGRGHGPHGFTSWMAGGGVKGGVTYGATDDIGFAAVENRVSIADWHATILHLLGLHHEQLVFERSGLNEKLTSTFPARIVREVLA